MLCFLLLPLLWTTVSSALQPSTRAAAAAVAATLQDDGTKPFIYHCRSPNMEVFTCWWRPLERRGNLTYTLHYSTGDRASQECPDYVSGGPHSCFFDIKHTQVWEIYCLNVTARSGSRAVASHRLCLDVADIVEPDPPFNLSYSLLNDSTCESCCTVLLSWAFPIVTQVRDGWITLVYQLRYRNLAQPHTWKVKERLREPHVELLDLPKGTYEFMVRCRSTNSKHWSAWSESVSFSINRRAVSDRMLAFILITTVAVMAFLIIGFAVAPRGKRIKAFLLPPVPKPRIRGLEPVLLKTGKMDEINRHFASFHGYKSPQSCIETWYQVSVDACAPAPPAGFTHISRAEGVTLAPYVTGPDWQTSPTGCSPAPYCSSPAPSGEVAPPPVIPSHAPPELVSFPGLDYSVILDSSPPPQDFYTCVTGVASSGALHLVPCLPDMLKSAPYLQFKEAAELCTDKSSQRAALLERQMEALPCDTDPGESARPLLPHTSD